MTEQNTKYKISKVETQLQKHKTVIEKIKNILEKYKSPTDCRCDLCKTGDFEKLKQLLSELECNTK